MGGIHLLWFVRPKSRDYGLRQSVQAAFVADGEKSISTG